MSITFRGEKRGGVQKISNRGVIYKYRKIVADFFRFERIEARLVEAFRLWYNPAVLLVICSKLKLGKYFLTC